jgi:hypothetical protein
MQNTVQLTITVAEDIPELLAELVGGGEHSGRFLTQLIRVIYAQQKAAENPHTALQAIIVRHNAIEESLDTNATHVKSCVADLADHLQLLSATHRMQ